MNPRSSPHAQAAQPDAANCLDAVPRRYALVDVLRGVAIALMVIYHLSYDLKHFGFADFDFYHDPFWLSLRTVIVSLFLSLVGVSLVLATEHGLDRRAYLRRLGWLVLFAAGISISSRLMFPGRGVFFGILHFIAFASVAALPLARRPRLSFVLGITLLLVASLVRHPLFDQPWLQWFGLMTYKPATEDYVPVLPWFGVVLIGISLGHLWLRAPWLRALRAWPGDSPPARALAGAGRYSLWIYVLHQPVLFTGLWLIVALTTA